MNALASGRLVSLVVNGWVISCETALIWMSLDHTNSKSILVQVMAWCRQAPSHYLSQCWPRSQSTYGITRPQWVNRFKQIHQYSLRQTYWGHISGTEVHWEKWLPFCRRHFYKCIFWNYFFVVLLKILLFYDAYVVNQHQYHKTYLVHFDYGRPSVL